MLQVGADLLGARALAAVGMRGAVERRVGDAGELAVESSGDGDVARQRPQRRHARKRLHERATRATKRIKATKRGWRSLTPTRPLGGPVAARQHYARWRPSDSNSQRHGELMTRPLARPEAERAHCCAVPALLAVVPNSPRADPRRGAPSAAAAGLIQQACTRAFRLWGAFGSILPWRTTQRNVAWIWGPGSRTGRRDRDGERRCPGRRATAG